MFLHQLLGEFDPHHPLEWIPNFQITGIAEDSRQVNPGDLFIARPGTKTQGSKFIQQAHLRGAVAVISATPLADSDLPVIVIPDLADATSQLAHIFYQHPSRQMKVLGITGTNGKTTTAYLVRHLLTSIGQKCGLVGTVEVDDGKTIHQATLTTPSAVDIAAVMAQMRDNGCKACAIEVSSHALHQGRVAGVNFAAAAFTNLTLDHLDYHGTMENYAAAKARLFDQLDESSIAIVNAQDNWSPRMVQYCHARVVKFGLATSADYRAQDISLSNQGSRFTLHAPHGHADVELKLIGKHNIANALTAAAIVGSVFKIPVEQIANALKNAQGAPGRLQSVLAGQPFAVLVDYAHTDDALQNVLAALRPLTRGRLRLLFGCGGDRDRSKRPLMARAAALNADDIYVTSDNPRTENPKSILDEIVAGFPKEKTKPIVVEIDRRKAIEKILADAQSGDVVLLAGKGHENYQIIGTSKHHFDDVEEARKILEHRRAS
jgi:UDP-N-acetylmuramoyl-L-alanyl-D-glutamate--2,6-diaminopimelate ligase